MLGIGAGILIARSLATSKGVASGSRREAACANARSNDALSTAARLFFSGSAVLSFSGAADSGLEHYRGGFTNRAMFLAPTVSALTLGTSARQALHAALSSTASRTVYWLSALTGLAGLGFHSFNIGKRIGRFNLLNLFYGAPIMAPGTQFAAGVCGLLGDRINRYLAGQAPLPPRRRATGVAAAGALLATSAEAALLHYRGAFQNPYMVLPATVPPVTALAISAAAVRPSRRSTAVATILSGATAALGVLGTVFHAYGIHRNMGGWKNWSQMILQGPPLPAPPGFTGVALAAIAALQLETTDD